MCSFLLRQHDEVDRYGGLTHSYPLHRQVPVSRTLWKSCAVDNHDLPSTAVASKDAELCVLITALCHLTKSPVEFLNGSLFPECPNRRQDYSNSPTEFPGRHRVLVSLPSCSSERSPHAHLQRTCCRSHARTALATGATQSVTCACKKPLQT